MISFSIEKIDSLVAKSCADCVRKHSNGEFCKNFCKLNQRIIYTCPFCGKDGMHEGMHLIEQNGIKNFARGILCYHCKRDVVGLYDMTSQLNGLDLRIGYHRGFSIYAKAHS